MILENFHFYLIILPKIKKTIQMHPLFLKINWLYSKEHLQKSAKGLIKVNSSSIIFTDESEPLKVRVTTSNNKHFSIILPISI